MRLNDGKFRDNGGVGYLLKPECLRTGARFHPDTGPFPAVGVKLTVQVCYLCGRLCSGGRFFGGGGVGARHPADFMGYRLTADGGLVVFFRP